jgi:predicted DCC family thiol-disulfide oxidoreductase YuxK
MSVCHAVLLYDGVCGFCNRLVQFALRHDRENRLRFATLQGRYGQAALKRHPELHGIESVVFLETSVIGGVECAYVRSEAILRLASYMGGFWSLLAGARILPAHLRDHLYDVFASRRYRFFGLAQQCPALPSELRARFFD